MSVLPRNVNGRLACFGDAFEIHFLLCLKFILIFKKRLFLRQTVTNAAQIHVTIMGPALIEQEDLSVSVYFDTVVRMAPAKLRLVGGLRVLYVMVK